MTRLYIDGVEAVLPDDFSISVKRENPLFTKNGEYTYDITLSLMHSVNADLYAHINRLNRADSQGSGRTAILIADNRVYCRGTEIVTAWSTDSVTIQIASGNSEVNYMMGGDRLISELPLGEFDWSPDDAYRYISKIYPQVEFSLFPVYNENTNVVVNEWAGEDHQPPATDFAQEWMEQPYLMAYISMVVQSIGYTMVLNQLEQTPLRCLCIVNIRSHKPAEMLPGWTVLQFIEEVEKLTGSVFVFDNRKKEVRLMVRSSFYDGSTTSHVRLVEDSYTVEVEQETDIDDNSTSDISYNSPDNSYFRYHILSDAVTGNAKQDSIPSSFGTTSDRIAEWFALEEHRNRETIYTDETDGTQYLWIGEDMSESRRHIAFSYRIDYLMVNEFASVSREDPSSEIECRIGPTSMERVPLQMIVSRSEDQFGNPDIRSVHFPVQIPSACIEQTKESTNDLKELIEGGTVASESATDYLQLAFYSGMTELKYGSYYAWNYPLPYTDVYRELFDKNDVITYERTNTEGATLRLSSLDAVLYNGGYEIDFHTQVKIKSHDPNLFDPRTLFEIRNKRYVCKEMEYTIGPDGRNGPWQGTFYPITIDDTSAGVRWILTDGKWRDGGVWFDNGRWLDT